MLFLCLLFVSQLLTAHDWQNVAPGVDYLDLKNQAPTPWSHIHVFRIDLNHNQLGIVMANELSQQHASVSEFAKHDNAIIAINAGFFDKDYRPLGLRISHQHEFSPMKHISWWGIFYIKNQKPHVVSLHQYKHALNTDFAVQSGPRLLIHGQIIPSLKPGLAERSSLGITANGQVIILVTNNAPMTTTTLANLMRAPPLLCNDALNLDGGSSSQLYANMGRFKRYVPGFSQVSDAIIVKPR